MKIGIFDSGIGGTTVLSALKSLLGESTNEYFYLADSKNCPYGEKSDLELKTIVENNVLTLKNWGAKIIVLACNTATTRCIKNLRKTFPDLIFVGTEPAVKLAATMNAKNVLILATPATIHSERLATLVEENRNKNQTFTLKSCPGLADAIEKYLNHNPAKIAEKLAELFPTPDETYDAVVLGCTHYPLIKDQLQPYFPNALLLDGAAGVAHRVKTLIEDYSKPQHP